MTLIEDTANKMAPEEKAASVWRAETPSTGAIYIGVACQSENESVRILHPPLQVPVNDEDAKRDPPAAVRRLVAVERSRKSVELGQRFAEHFRTRVRIPSVKLEPSAGDYVLENTPGPAVAVELPVRAAPGSINLCTAGATATAMADAIHEFLTPKER